MGFVAPRGKQGMCPYAISFFCVLRHYRGTKTSRKIVVQTGGQVKESSKLQGEVDVSGNLSLML